MAEDYGAGRAADGATAGTARLESTPWRLLDQARRRPDKPAYGFHDGEAWRTRSWADYAEEVRQAGRALLALGLEPGQAVAILGYNRPEWTIAGHAAMLAGGALSGIYWTSAPAEIAYIVGHSEAPILIVETREQAEQALQLKADLPKLRQIVMMRGATPPDGVMSFEAFMALGSEPADSPQLDRSLDSRLDDLKPTDIGALIYTSGTTGPPKAVMLNHAALAWTAEVTANAFFPPGEGRRSLSYLPLAHIAEQQASVHNHVVGGGCLYFARSMETVAEDLLHVRPSGFFGVPRVWEKMQAKIQARLAEAPESRRKMAEWAMSAVRARLEAELEGRSPGPWVSLQAALGDALVVKKIRAALGLDEASFLVSGAAPISPEVLRFFLGLGMVVYEGYGQSETAAPTSANLPGAVRFGSVGRAFDGIEVKTDADGELLVRTPGIFAGYMKDNEATEASFTAEGWLKTGDLARIDEDGFIFLTGRKKDIIITSGGKNITPANIETALMDIPVVEHAVVTGDGRPFLGALITLSEEALADMRAKGLIDGAPHESPAVREAIQAGVERVNADLARVEQVREFVVLDTPLSIEAGELTPTLKVKRRNVLETRQEAVAAIYGDYAGVDGDYR